MNENLYNKEIICPVCSQKIIVTKVKTRGCKVKSRDTDFCIYYEDLNPILYDAWVCENCGYAAQSEKFLDIPPRDANTIKAKISPRWKKRSFIGDRTLDIALDAFKLVLINHQARGAKASELAKICMRIAWLYRMKKDEKEHEFIKYALRYYTETYEKENFPAEKLDENTCMYMIGELNFRAGNLDESVKWFSRLISSPDARRIPTLIEAARDEFQLVKDKLAAAGEAAGGSN